jgi:hypothetical protein
MSCEAASPPAIWWLELPPPRRGPSLRAGRPDCQGARVIVAAEAETDAPGTVNRDRVRFS